MQLTILTPEDFKTTNWSGGTTTQLYIYPPTADYAKRNFKFRLSTAKVEVEKSDFTSLPGISRQLMILDGDLTITHQNHYSKTLRKFDTDSFEGDWKTSALGTCTDFNLMTKGSTHGKLSALKTEALKDTELNIPSCDFFFIYLYKGGVSIKILNDELSLPTSGLLVLEKPQVNSIIIKSDEPSELIMAEIKV